MAQCTLMTNMHMNQARRQGGFEGVRSNPPFDLPKDFIYTSKLYILLSILPFDSSPLALLLLRITAVHESVCRYNMRVRSWRTSTERMCKLFTPLRQKGTHKYMRK